MTTDSPLARLIDRRRFGMRPGLESMRALCAALGNPETSFPAWHIAGTNGKGATAALLDASLRASFPTASIARYTSPHLVSLRERFVFDGNWVDEDSLQSAAQAVADAIETLPASVEVTYFEALTALEFVLCRARRVRVAVLECGLGGRLDATNICRPEMTIITRIGLDHCAWLGSTLREIAREKAGIVKAGVPVVVGRNEGEVVEEVRRVADEKGAPFVYAPDVVREEEVPTDLSLAGAFNRENAQTAMAALKTARVPLVDGAFANVSWPGRFQKIGNVLLDGAHNPPAAAALAKALSASGLCPRPVTLIFGACADKDVGQVLSALRPLVARAYAVRTSNPRSLAADALAATMRSFGLAATPCASLAEAFSRARVDPNAADGTVSVLVAGSLFLVGDALQALRAPLFRDLTPDPSERL